MIKINDTCYLDSETHTITIQIERSTFTIFVEDFLDLYRDVLEAKEYLVTSPDHVVGEEGGTSREVILPKPDDEEYN